MTSKIVEVHAFMVWDTAVGDKVFPPINGGRRSKRTADDIERIGGEIVPGTAKTVDASSLDPYGRYYPRN